MILLRKRVFLPAPKPINRKGKKAKLKTENRSSSKAQRQQRNSQAEAFVVQKQPKAN
jgi:hypothetical protein